MVVSTSHLLPIGNSIDGFVKEFRKSLDDSIITDATMTWSMFDPTNTVVPGCNAVAMPHISGGHYRGSATPTSDLTDGTQYKLVITCTNYPTVLTKYKTARRRPLEM